MRTRLAAPLLLTLCLAAAFLAPVAHAQPGVDHVDGYLSISPDGRCMVLKQHDGALLALFGRRRGLQNNDHLRLEGKLTSGASCGAPGGFQVTSVQTVWADDNHKTTYYDPLKDGSFDAWVGRTRPH